jgi:ABC-type sugar transport system permease subunit
VTTLPSVLQSIEVFDLVHVWDRWRSGASTELLGTQMSRQDCLTVRFGYVSAIAMLLSLAAGRVVPVRNRCAERTL